MYAVMGGDNVIFRDVLEKVREVAEQDDQNVPVGVISTSQNN